MYDMLCPGCGHRTAMILIDDIVKQKNIKEKTVLALDVACCSLLIDFVAYDSVMCAHGRVLDVTKGYKTMRKENIVISYMGDGAAYSIGMEEMVHAARRNDDALVVVINNGLYSMTGGQTTPTYIDVENAAANKGFLIENLLAGFDISYLARAALTDKENIDRAKKFLDKALTKYMAKGGFNLVELLSPCPTNYKVSAQNAAEIINNLISKIYKVKEFVS